MGNPARFYDIRQWYTGLQMRAGQLPGVEGVYDSHHIGYPNGEVDVKLGKLSFFVYVVLPTLPRTCIDLAWT